MYRTKRTFSFLVKGRLFPDMREMVARNVKNIQINYTVEEGTASIVKGNVDEFSHDDILSK